MKIWLKGGLIGLGISASLLLLSLVPFAGSLFLLNMVIGMPLTLFLNFLGLKMYDPSYDSVAFWVGGILNPLIVSFIIGAIIGWIIGKMKSRA